MVYKSILVSLPVLIPGGMCAPPLRVSCPVLMVMRTDSRNKNTCRARGTVIYTHGNATDIGGAAEEAKTMSRELECNVVVPEYPGYGVAGGYATEDTVDAVVHATIRLMIETLGTPANRVILYGRSVGTGPAAAAAARLSRVCFSYTLNPDS